MPNIARLGGQNQGSEEDVNEQATQTASATDGAPVAGADPTATQTRPGGESGGEPRPARTYTDQEVNDLIAREKRKLQDSEDIKQGRAAIKRLAELEEAQKSEAEKLTERATKAEQLAADRAAKYRTALIRASFTAQAAAAGVPADRIDDAYTLADLSAVEVDEDRNSVSGIDKAIAALVKAKPYLTGTGRPAPDTNVTGSGQGVTREQQVAQALAELTKRGGGDIP